MRFCERTDSTVELYALNAKAQAAGKRCVGVTKRGDLFTVTGKDHNKISVEAAAEILETTPVEVQKFLDARGEYQIKDPEPIHVTEPEPLVRLSSMPKQTEVPPMPAVVSPKSPEPRGEEPQDPITAAAKVVAQAVGAVLAEHEAGRSERLERIELKIDKLKEAVDKLQETVENFYL